ncbi:hypothetical protein [Curtobacterium sp. MCJR17_043]
MKLISGLPVGVTTWVGACGATLGRLVVAAAGATGKRSVTWYGSYP